MNHAAISPRQREKKSAIQSENANVVMKTGSRVPISSTALTKGLTGNSMMRDDSLNDF